MSWDQFDQKINSSNIENRGALKIPNELDLLLKILGNPFNLKILHLLVAKGPLPFINILKNIKTSKGNISSQLKRMLSSNMITIGIIMKDNSKQNKTYQITDTGQLLVNAISKWNQSQFEIWGRTDPEYWETFPSIDTDKYFEISSHLCKALGNRIRLKILEILSDQEKSFTEIAQTLGIENGRTAIELKILESVGICQNYFQKRLGSDEFSFYSLTKMGRAFIMSILEHFPNKLSMDISEHESLQDEA
jgi:predicted transcriptional regulator